MQTLRPNAPFHRIGILLFLWFCLFYLLTTSGHIFTPDGVLMYLVTEGLVERGDPAMPAQEGDWPFQHTEVGQDGRRYAIYGLGPSLVAIPTYLIGKALIGIVPPGSEAVFEYPLKLFHPRELPYFVTIFAVSLTNAFVAAAVAWMVFAAGWAFGFRQSTSLALAFIAGIASPLWHYSKTFFSEPMAALTLLLFLFFILRFRETSRGAEVFWAGVALSATVLVKIANAVFFVAAIPLAIAFIRRRAQDRLKYAVLFGAGLTACFPLILAYNAFRFGSIWETGYSSRIDFTHPFFQGFLGLLVSPGRGLFLYFPLAVIALAVAASLWRRQRALSAFLLAMFLIPLLFHATWWSWEGGWCWGPRFFIPVLPLLVLPAGYWIEDRRGHAVRTWILWIVVGMSAVVAFSGVIVNFNDYCALMKAHHGVIRSPYYHDMRWSWQWAPLLQYWGFEHKNFFLLTAAFSTPGARFWQLVFGGIAVALVGTSVLLGRSLARATTK